MTDLDRLIAAVEGDEPAPFDVFDCLGKQGVLVAGEFHMTRSSAAWGAYRGSLDCARSVHESLLPGWGASISVKERDDGFVMAWVSENSNEKKNARHADVRTYKCGPSRAWLLSILRAYRSMQEEA